MRLIIACILLFGWIYCVTRSNKNKEQSSGNAQSQQSNRKPVQLASIPELQKILVQLVGNDVSTARRLVASTKRKYGIGKPERWYWEKAIWDVDRDRR